LANLDRRFALSRYHRRNVLPAECRRETRLDAIFNKLLRQRYRAWTMPCAMA
jgi:hypothetical protein